MKIKVYQWQWWLSGALGCKCHGQWSICSALLFQELWFTYIINFLSLVGVEIASELPVMSKTKAKRWHLGRGDNTGILVTFPTCHHISLLSVYRAAYGSLGREESGMHRPDASHPTTSQLSDWEQITSSFRSPVQVSAPCKMGITHTLRNDDVCFHMA